MTGRSINWAIALLLISISAHLKSFGQTLECATTLSPEQYELKMLNNSEAGQSRARQFDLSGQTIPVIAITAHIVRTTAGEGGVSLDYLDDELDNINAKYLDAGLQFYLSEVNYVDNSQFYNFTFSEEEALANSNDVANTINIYFVNSVSFGLFAGTACGYAYLPGTGPDRILISNECADNGSTVVHEIGHFFDLIHTHGTSNSPGNTNELANGSNCATTGDLVCDTPADPVLSESTVNPMCVYTGNARDSNNELYIPDPNNIMSYSRVSCRDRFSPGQYERIVSSYQEDRGYLLLKPTIADFAASVDKVCEGEQIAFTDLSKNAVSYNWVFPGGTPSTSASSSPTILYDSEGVFSVSLEVTSVEGEKDFRIYENLITVRRSEMGVQSFEISFEDDIDLSDDSFNSDGERFFELNTDHASEGSKSVAIRLFGDPDFGSLDQFFLNHTITGDDEYLLQFQSAYAAREDFEDKLNIGIESWCRQQRHDLAVINTEELSQGLNSENEFFPTAIDWHRNGLFFTNPFPEEVVRIFFETESEGGNNLYIDNLRVRPVKPIDQDSIILVELYEALNGQLPWDMNHPVQNWEGVVLSPEAKVTALDFTNFGVSGVMPEALFELDQLKILNLEGNSVDPSEVILELSQLEQLSLANNGLTNLPADWSMMTSLLSLDLRNNELTQLPTSLLSLIGLQRLNARNNMLVFSEGVATELSSTLLSLDISANTLEDNPELAFQNSDTKINLSQNELGLSDMLSQATPSRIYSPQKLIGSVEYIATNSSLSLNCPISLDPGATVRWYMDNQLIPEAEDMSLELLDISPAYYQCEVMDEEVDNISILSKPFLINTPQSICEENLGGSYEVSTNYIDENGTIWELTSQVSLTTAANQVYDVSDLSFGAEAQVYAGSGLIRPLQFDCGEFFTPLEESHTYQVLSTEVDLELGELTLTWINDRGGQGLSTLTNLVPGPSNATDILSFQFTSQFAPEEIDFFNKTISLRVGCSEFSNIPSFILSDGASAYINGELQQSGISAQDFTSPVTYKVIGEDGVTTADWVITLIEEPSMVTATFTVENQSFCAPANGAIRIGDILVDGQSQIASVEDFDIKWATDPDFNHIIGSGLNMEGLTSGEYYLSIAEVFSGCGIRFDNIAIDDVTPVADLSINVTNPDRSCGGNHTGSLATTIDGLSPDLTIQWEKQNEDQWMSLDDLDNLLSLVHLGHGTYRQTILDNVTGCVYDQSATVSSQPSVLVANSSVIPNTNCAVPNGRISIDDIVQDGITIGLPVSGYSVAWYTDPAEQDLIGTAYSLEGLEAGAYYLRVIDDDLLCKSPLYSFFVASNTLEGVITVESFVNNSLCSSVGANGAISVSLDGGTEGYTFEWFSGSKISGSPIGNVASISELSGGTYTVKVTAQSGDEAGCFSILTTAIANDQELLELEIAATPVTVCGTPNGTVEVVDFAVDDNSQSISGTYEIEWSTSRLFTTVLSDKTSVTGLSPDTYYARVFNTLTGCTTGSITVSVGEDIPEISPDFTIAGNINCDEPFSGRISITNLEPITDYNFTWFEEPPEDGIEPISSAVELINLGAGTYYTVVEHVSSGCSQQFEHEVGDNLTIPLVTVDIQPQTNCTQPNGTIQIISVEDGTTDLSVDDYTVEWSAESNFSNVMSTEDNLEELIAGDYYLRVANKSTGCSSVASKYTITNDTVLPIISLVSSVVEKPALEGLGSIEVRVDYPGAYSLAWFQAETEDVVIGSELLLPDLKAGTYTVTITTDNVCNVSADFEVTADNRIPQVIELDLPDEVFVDVGSIVLLATATSGEAVNFAVASGPGQIIQDELRFLDAGQIELVAEVSANEEYFASATSASITVKPTLSISGQVLGSTSSGQARLYNQSWQLIDEVTFSGGGFMIDNLRPDNYHLEITPAGIASDSDLITYYPAEYSWREAGLIELSEDTVIDIELVTSPKYETGYRLEGTVGQITGNTVFTFGELKAVDIPLSNTDVYLIDQATAAIAAISSTSFGGRVIFDFIPAGEYYFFFNEVGSELDLSPLTVTIDASPDEKLFTLEVGDTDQIDVVVISGLEEWSGGALELYPNPVSSFLTIRFKDQLNELVMLKSYNLAGALQDAYEIQPGVLTYTLDISAYPSGTYLLQFIDNRGSLVKKIMKR